MSILSKLSNLVDDSAAYKSIDEISNYMVKHNFLSITIHDIVNGTQNKSKFIYSTINCVVYGFWY